jgi:hypothetical protein
MSKRSILTQLALMAVLAGGMHSVATAAAQRTFVASSGSDANPCTLVNPCRSFGYAVGQTLLDGEVIVLDSAGYGPATISQAVSINAPPGIYAGVSVFSGVGIAVNAGAGKVTLRGLTINNVQTGTTGIAFNSGAVLYLDNIVVTNFPTAGLSANVGVNGSLFVTDSTFHDNGTGALLSAATGTLTVSIDRTLFARNGVGIDLRDGTAGTKTSKVEVRDCTIADNIGTGVVVGSVVAGPVLVSLVSSLVSGNVTGIQVTGAANSAYVSDSTITRNTTALVYVTSGTAVSGTDNRLVNNINPSTFSSSTSKL